MAISTKDGEGTIIIAGAAIWIVIIGIVLGIVFYNTTSYRIDSLEKVNDKQWEYYRTLSGSMDDLIHKQDALAYNTNLIEERVTTTLDNIELSKYAKIYDLDITICKMDTEADEIKKRHVTMKNVVAINPSVEHTALVVETGLWYGSSVEIPTIMDDEDEYACGLEVISVK